MSNLNRYAVFAILDSRGDTTIRNEQHRLTNITGNKIALNFPVHITLKGRFIGKEDVVSKAFREIEPTSIKLPINIHLSRPVYIEPDLAWLEVLPQYQEYEILLSLHKIMEEVFREAVIEDEVPEAHKNSGFRPHITLGWGINPHLWLKYLSVAASIQQGKIDYIALVRYPLDWTQESIISVMLKIPS